VDALAAVCLVHEARREPADRERSQRVERDEAEVEEAGEANHDIQAERHHHVGQRGDGVVDEGTARGKEERKDQR